MIRPVAAPAEPERVKGTGQYTDGEYTYAMRHAPGRVGLAVGARVLNAGASFVDGASRGQGVGRITRGIAFFLSNPDLGEHLKYIVDTLCPYTTVHGPGGKPQVMDPDFFDLHFAGRLKSMRLWIEEAIEFECGDFLDELAEKFLGDLREKEQSGSDIPSHAPETASRGSGGSS